jgi:hypothetical protein
MAWGRNAVGQLGTGSSTGPEECGKPLEERPCSKKPVEVSGLSGVTAISGGAEFSLALLSSGRAMAWGANGSGDLGNGESEPYGPEHCGSFLSACATKPVEVKLVDVKGIAAGVATGLAFGPPPPAVAAISPQEGKKTGGTTVTITGSDFEEATEVNFGSVKSASVKVNSESSITAKSPPGTGVVDVTVTTPAGTSLTSLADKFYYERPTVKKLTPKKGPELGGTSVTITGTNFAGVTAVKFGGNNATSFKVNSATSITAVSPAHASGLVDVTLATPNGTSAISKKDRFKYT